MMLPQEVYELSAWAQRVGVDDPLPALRSISLIDTDAIRQVGTDVWSQSHVTDDPWRSQFLARFVLADEADRLLLRLSPEGWDDAGYVAFERHMIDITDRMAELAEHCAVIGDQLVEIADAFEMHWVELCGFVVGTVGLILAAVLVGPPFLAFLAAGAVGGLVVAVFGYIIAYAGYLTTLWSSAKPRLDALAEATDRFNEIAPPGRWIEPEAV